MNFFIKLIFSLIFLLSTLFSQTQRGSNIASGTEDIPPSMSGNGQVIVVKHGSAFFVYAWNGSAWAQRFNTSINPYSVDINYDGSTVIVGSPDIARVYQWNGSTYTQKGSNIQQSGTFGSSVSISNDGNIVAIGASSGENSSGAAVGLVYVYYWNNNQWSLRGNAFEGPQAREGYGENVTISGDGTVVSVGMNGYDDDSAGNGNVGLVRTYKWWGSNWAQYGPDIVGTAANQNKGSSVSLSYDGKTLAVGSKGVSGSVSGKVDVYTYQFCNGQFNQWCQKGSTLNASNASAEGHFGASVSLTDGGLVLAVGIPNDNGGGNNAGAARIYDFSSNSWTQRGNDINGNAGNECGTGVSLDSTGTFVASSCPEQNGRITKVYAIDATAPTITNMIIGPDNQTVTVTLSEAVYNTNGGSGALEASDFNVAISGGSASLTSSTPTSISKSGDNYTLGIGLSGTINASETIVVTPVDNGIYDLAGNEANTSQSNNSLKLHVIAAAPTTSGWETGAVNDMGTVYDIDVDNLSPNSHYAMYGVKPEIITFPTSTGIEVAWRDQNSNTIVITKYVETNSVLTESGHLRINSLGHLAGFTKDDAGNYYIMTSLPDEITTAAQPTYDRQGILRLYKISSSGALTYWKDLISGSVATLPIFKPMTAGTGRLVYGGGKLLFSFSANTQYDTAINQRHQLHREFRIDPSSGTFEDESGGISHSFDQRLIYDGQKFVSMALGDMSRGVSISYPFTTRNYDLGGGSYSIISWVHAFGIKGGSESQTSNGYNNTFTRLGSIAKSTNGYPVVFASEKSTAFSEGDNSKAILDERNLAFVHVKNDFLNQVTSSNLLDISITDVSNNSNVADPYNITVNTNNVNKTGTNRGVVWLTNYSNLNTENVEKPKMVGIGNDKFIVLWEKWKISTTVANAYGQASDYVSTWGIVVDEYGNIVTAAKDLGSFRLQRGDDIVSKNSKAYWVRGDQSPNKLIIYSVDANLNLKNESSPIITGSTVSSDNSTISVVFSESIVNAQTGGSSVEATDFSLSISSGTATLSSASPSSISISGNTVTLGIPKNGVANGSEVLTVSPVSNSIFDVEGNVVSTSQNNNSVSLNSEDNISPTITSVTQNNNTIYVTISESVFNAASGTGELDVNDFILSISGGSATLTSTTPKTIDRNVNTYILTYDLNGISDGQEIIMVNFNANSVFDASGNIGSTNQNNNTIQLNDNREKVAPTISSISILSKQDLTYKIQLNFSENIFNTSSGSGNLEKSDFDVQIAEGAVSNVEISSVSQANNIITIDLVFSNLPNGDEVITISPNQNSIYDAAANVASISQSNNSFNLDDRVPPGVFDLIYPENNFEINITSKTIYDTLYFSWNPSSDPYGDVINYKIQFDENTESLFSTLITENTPAFSNASTKMYQIPYRKIQEFMFTNDLKLLSGTWNVIAEDDSENKTIAENGPFNISINASSLSVEELLTPKEFKLYSNFPNPFNPSTTILYALPKKSHVSIEIYDILGKRIKVLVSESQNMGHHSKIWDGTNEHGEIVSGGVYIYVLNAGSYYDSKKMIYMK